MAPLFLLLALPATFLATVEAVGFFRGLRPLPLPFPMMPLVHPIPLVHPMHMPFMPLPPQPIMPVRRTTRTRETNTRSEIRAVPLNSHINDRQGDVFVVINDSDCFSGLCRGGGFNGGMGGSDAYLSDFDMMGRRSGPGRSNYNIHDADHVVIGGNGRY